MGCPSARQVLVKLRGMGPRASAAFGLGPGTSSPATGPVLGVLPLGSDITVVDIDRERFFKIQLEQQREAISAF